MSSCVGNQPNPLAFWTTAVLHPWLHDVSSTLWLSLRQRWECLPLLVTYCSFQQTELQARDPCFVPGVCYRHTGGTLLLADWRSKYIAVHTNLAGLQRKWQIWFSVSSAHFTWDKSPHRVPGGTLALSRLCAYFLLLSGQGWQFWSGYWPNQILCSKTGTPHLSPVPEGLPEKNIWYTNVINDIYHLE